MPTAGIAVRTHAPRLVIVLCPVGLGHPAPHAVGLRSGQGMRRALPLHRTPATDRLRALVPVGPPARKAVENEIGDVGFQRHGPRRDAACGQAP